MKKNKRTILQRVKTQIDRAYRIMAAARTFKPSNQPTTYEDACIMQATAIKTAIKQSGLSREAVANQINAYFGWTDKGKHLSIHMLNHHLSKPSEYPIPAPLLYAIHHITGSLEPCRSFAKAEGGDTISKEEKTDLALGKLELSISEMQKLKRELKGRG